MRVNAVGRYHLLNVFCGVYARQGSVGLNPMSRHISYSLTAFTGDTCSASQVRIELIASGIALAIITGIALLVVSGPPNYDGINAVMTRA